MSQKVLITTAASGIGLEIARAFSAAGAKVFITDINTQGLEAVTSSFGMPCVPVELSTGVQP